MPNRHIYTSIILIVCINKLWLLVNGFSINGIRPSFGDKALHIRTRKDTKCCNDERQQQQLFMISNIFGGGRSSSSSSSSASSTLPTLPRDVKEAVSKCREATQAALQDRISRMDFDFPVGTKFGVEKVKSKTKSQLSKVANDDGKPSKIDFDTSDRELARIFVEMFQPVGNDKIVVTFNDASLAEVAKQQWKSDSIFGDKYCQILSLDRRKSPIAKKVSKNEKNKNKAKGFAARMAAEINDNDTNESNNGPYKLPDGIEVAIFVSPGQKELPIIEKVCTTVGMGTLVILLNARKYTIQNFGSTDAKNLFLNEFQSVFHLSAAPQSIAPGCLLYHSYDTTSSNNNNNDKSNPKWILARKPSVGQPKTILVTSHRPNDDEIQNAFDNLELSDVEKNVETALENVSKWFR